MLEELYKEANSKPRQRTGFYKNYSDKWDIYGEKSNSKNFY